MSPLDQKLFCSVMQAHSVGGPLPVMGPCVLSTENLTAILVAAPSPLNTQSGPLLDRTRGPALPSDSVRPGCQIQGIFGKYFLFSGNPICDIPSHTNSGLMLSCLRFSFFKFFSLLNCLNYFLETYFLSFFICIKPVPILRFYFIVLLSINYF